VWAAGLALVASAGVLLALVGPGRLTFWRRAFPSVPALAGSPLPAERVLPIPRRSETNLARARTLATSGHLHDALAALNLVRPTDPQKAEADRLRADIQRQLLSLADTGPAESPPPAGSLPR
jgi:hypothetical protein